MPDLKTLALDIEVHPALVYTYELFRPILGHKQIKEPSRISCVSYQWQGKKKVEFISEYHNGRDEMLKTLWNLIDEADVVVGYNSKKFDVPWMLGEFIAEGMPKPSPVKHIDLYLVMRSNSRFLSKKLAYVSDRLLEDKKLDANTMELSLRADSDDPAVVKKAWAEMKKYSVRDTAMLFPLFDQLKSYVKMPHPVGDEISCHACGSQDLQRRGYATTLTGTYQKYVCTECGSWFRGKARTDKSEYRAL